MNSNDIATIGNFTVATVTKTGRTVRDFAGVVASGNRAARDAALQSLINHQWREGQFGTVAKNAARVFGTLFTDNAGFVQMDTVTGTTVDKSRKTTRQCWDDMIGGLEKRHEAKAFKGEKLLWLGVIKNARATYENRKASMIEAEQAAKQADDAAAAAEQAQKDAGLLIDVVATEAAPLALPAPADAAPAIDAAAPADAAPADDARVNMDAEALF